jgi:hypothetical protein
MVSKRIRILDRLLWMLQRKGLITTDTIPMKIYPTVFRQGLNLKYEELLLLKFAIFLVEYCVTVHCVVYIELKSEFLVS